MIVKMQLLVVRLLSLLLSRVHDLVAPLWQNGGRSRCFNVRAAATVVEFDAFMLVLPGFVSVHARTPRRLSSSSSVDGLMEKHDSRAFDRTLGKYDRADTGEYDKKTKLYPVWNTPVADMGDFGVGVT